MVWEVGRFSSPVRCRCTLVANLSFVFDALLASFFNDFPGGILVGVACGGASTLPVRPGDPTSNHRDAVSLRSSIAPHAARPKLADTVIRTSATRAQAPTDTRGLIVADP